MSPDGKVRSASDVDKVLEFYRGIATRDAALALRHLDPGRFVQHDPNLEDGVDGMRRYVEQLAPDTRLDVVRILQDGELIVVQADGKVRGDGTFFDVFRFDDGLLIEHWGFAAPAGPPNQNGHTQLDGPVEAERAEETEVNRAFVREYYRTFHIAGRHDLADRYFAGSPMLRHEPGVADGVDAFLADLKVLTRDRTIDEIRLLAGRGDLFFLAALGTHRGEPCAYIDLYRVEDGTVMEHWGFPQTIPPAERRRNGNPML